MTKTLRLPTSLAAILLLTCSAVYAAGGSSIDSTAETATPEQQANEHYNEGLVNRDHAWKLQKKAANSELPEEKRAKLQKKMRNAYERAIAEFTAAITLHPEHHQAFGSLGYVYRQTGDYAKALAAYGEALALKPDYAEAVEYRAEAYLGLNRIDDAKASYETLAQLNAKLAGELLHAMHAWVEQRRADPAGINVGALDAFERWVEDRGEGKVASTLRKSGSW